MSGMTSDSKFHSRRERRKGFYRSLVHNYLCNSLAKKDELYKHQLI